MSTCTIKYAALPTGSMYVFDPIKRNTFLAIQSVAKYAFDTFHLFCITVHF